jgi:hypothetical protein
MTETLNEYCKRTEQEKRELSQKIAQMECSAFEMEKIISGQTKDIVEYKTIRSNIIAENTNLKQAIHILYDTIDLQRKTIANQKFTIDAQSAAIREWEQDEKERMGTPTKKTCENCRHRLDGGFDCATCIPLYRSMWEPIPTHKG